MFTYTAKEKQTVNAAWSALLCMVDSVMGACHQLDQLARQDRKSLPNDATLAEARFYVMRHIQRGLDGPGTPIAELAGIRPTLVLACLFGAGLTTRSKAPPAADFTSAYGDARLAHETAVARNRKANNAALAASLQAYKENRS